MAKTAPDVSLQRSRLKRDGLDAGTVAPAFTLPGLYGGTHDLNAWIGRKVLLMFSDPDCGPCAEVSKKLQQRHLDGADATILAISRGDIERNRLKAQELQLSFQILLQKQWEVSREYAIFATPAAYLIDEQGTISTDVAVGTEAILNLLPDRQNPLETKIEARLRELQIEFTKGQEELQSLDQRRQYVSETMQRITGAKLVLAEFMRAQNQTERIWNPEDTQLTQPKSDTSR